MTAQKAEILEKHMSLLKERYDFSNRSAQGVTMSRGKPIQEGIRVKLSRGMTWEMLAATRPEEIPVARHFEALAEAEVRHPAPEMMMGAG
jgi:hypothetical protein